jgi:hypothetical protein
VIALDAALLLDSLARCIDECLRGVGDIQHHQRGVNAVLLHHDRLGVKRVQHASDSPRMIVAGERRAVLRRDLHL